MNVAVVDVGSNTVRLLVACRAAGGLVTLREERAYLRLGADLERSCRIPPEKIARAASVVRTYGRLARELGAEVVDVIVTAPGRQGEDPGALVSALTAAAGNAVRVLSPEEEGRLAYDGALAGCPSLTKTIAVCDVGGGSTELLVGTRSGPAWCRSFDVGSLRLTSRFFGDDPPTSNALDAAGDEVRRAFAGVTPPLPRTALATGGSAKALRKLVGKTLGEPELLEAIRIARRRSPDELARDFGFDPLRAQTLAAGAVILLEAHRRIGVPFAVARGGIREGAALELLAEAAAA